MTDATTAIGRFEHGTQAFLDGVRWIRFAAAHTEIHLRQLRALRAHPEMG